MIFDRFRHKHKRKYLRLRIESCVSTILDLNDRLGEGKIKPEIVKHFEKLKESLHHVTDESVNERDIDRIEQATNDLLAEIRITLDEGTIGSFHEGRLH